ncbi:MAG: GntR family transcriptional regulator [Hyphomicrobiales bacterium]|nr:GntR family transcriptional regulator [Hyphomicrobiales bacterium]
MVQSEITVKDQSAEPGVETEADPARAPRLERLEKRRRLADRVSDNLLRGIASGRLPPGERLIETEIADDLGISRIPLREALSVLESQGIIIADAHRRRWVVSFDDIRVLQVCTTRLTLERQAVVEASQTYRRDPGRIAALDAVIARMKETVGGDADTLAINQNDVDYHTEIYAATDNPCLQVLWETLSRHVAIVFALETFKRIDPAHNLVQHERLRDLLLEGDKAALEAEIEDHIMGYINT